MEEEEATSSSTELRYSTKKQNNDRISSLPDEVLCLILSFLPTKFAVGTSILSTRWRHLWTSVPVLDFDGTVVHASSPSYDDYILRKQLFLDFVDRVLVLNTVQSIRRLSLTFSPTCDPSRVNQLICKALMRNLNEIHLHLQHCHLPQTFFISNQLTVLKLEYLRNLNVPDHASFPALKVLHLKYLSCLNDAITSKLLSASPCLEELFFVRYWNDEVLTLYVHSCILKSLTIHGNFKLVVDVPKLEFLQQYATRYTFELPQSIFSSVGLVILKLQNDVVLDVPFDAYFPKLKTLHLKYLQHLDDATIRQILSASPALEELVILGHFDRSMQTSSVHSCTLKSLTIDRSFELVDAPNLEFLELVDCTSKDLNFVCLSSLVKAVVGANVKNATISSDDYVETVRFLRQISHVKVLCFSGFLAVILEEICSKHPDAFNSLPTFHNVTHLEVKSVLSGSSVVPYILERTPNLKVLVLEVSENHMSNFFSSQKLNPPKSVPRCFSCLGKVEFRKFFASEIQMEIVEYLLKNAMVLTNMTISRGSASRDPIKLLNILKKFSPASGLCQIFVS